MNSARRFKWVVATTVGLLAVLSPFDAYGTAIDDGIAWLETNQAASGLWGETKSTPFRDATSVLTVLGPAGADSAVIASGAAAVDDFVANNTDYYARKILALASVGAEVPARLRTDLGNQRNEDGAWGYQRLYESSLLETALAIRGLKTVQSPSDLSTAVTFLTSNQNADGGWGLAVGDTSRVFFTGHVLLALTLVESEFGVSTEIGNAVAWLKTQDLGDGGFGTGGVSNAFETGLALSVLAKADPAAAEVAAAQSYLETSQMVDGSWQGDAYHTAMALFGLTHIAPDLAVSSGDISLSNPLPSDDELVDITATVRNVGVLASGSIVVRAYDGDPDDGGTQIGSDAVIATVAAGGSEDAVFSWDTAGLAGDHTITVVADALNAVGEPNELNNVGAKSQKVYLPPDFMISSITFDPEEPDTSDTIIISTTVKNIGELAGISVALQIWNGDPEAGGTPFLASPGYIIGSIAAGGQFTLNLDVGTTFDMAGDYLIFAKADPDSTIREIDELNNEEFATLRVGAICIASDALSLDLNLLGLPVETEVASSSYTVLADVTGAIEATTWDRTSQSWRSAAVDTISGQTVGQDAPVDLRDGFFVRMTQPSLTAEFCGSRVTEHGCTHFEEGLNMLSVPNEDACYSSYALLEDISGAEEINRWDASLQAWETAIQVSEGVFTGPDFPIVPGAGYFAKVGQSSDWCSAVCDTATVPPLPDLRITSSDFFFDPDNTIVSGETVGIFVNMDNIGEETAFTPLLDIWLGDPDAGGTLLLRGNIPVDVPPGGSSGYWGNDFTITGSGTVDIWGIADALDAIPEQDETNNRASSPLIILPPLAPVASADGGEGLRLIPVDGSGRLRPHPTLGRRGLARADEPDEPPTRAAFGKDQVSGEASVIENVRISNVTSAAATVTWTTDADVTGCVGYGTGPDLAAAQCSDIAGDVHSVVLRGLTADTEYVFQIESGGLTDDAGGALHRFRTAVPGAGIPAALFGRTVDEAGDEALGRVVVSATLRHGDAESHPLTAMTGGDGMWSLNLGNLKSRSTGSVMRHTDGDLLVVEVFAGHQRVHADTVRVEGASPYDLGTMAIGAAEVSETPTVSAHYLNSNFPNPFQAGTTIRFGLPSAGRARLSIFNVMGQKVVDVIDGVVPAGNHLAVWDGRDARGHPVSSGIYFYRLTAGEFTQVRKMFLVR